MAGAIIGNTSANRKGGAPTAQLDQLYNYLNHTLGRYFVINGYGDALGPSKGRPWSLTGTGSVTQYVQSGGVFIDYCGWPMSYQISPAGAVADLGPKGFRTFAKALGWTWLSAASFQSKETTGSDHRTYPFPRGYVQSGSINGLYLPHGTFQKDHATWTMNGGGYAAMLGLHRPGLGWYFWGEAYDPWLYQLTGPADTPRHIPSNVFGAFIEACVHGQSTVNGRNFTLNITHQPYTVPKTGQQQNTTGPSTPYGSNPGPSGSGKGTGSGGGTGSTSRNPGHSGTKPVNGQCPAGQILVGDVCVQPGSSGASSTPSWVKPVGVGAGVVTLLGVGAYVLVQEHRQGQGGA